MDLKFKVPLVTLAVFCGLSVPLGFAKHTKLHNGAYVFDPKRFQEQVQQYGQKVLQVANEAAKTAQMAAARISIPEGVKQLSQEYEKHQHMDKLKSTSLTSVSPDNSLQENTHLIHKAWTLDEAIKDVGEYETSILDYLQRANAEALQYTSVLTLDSNQRNEALSRFLKDNSTAQNGGNISEKQKGNMIRSTTALNEADQGQIQIAKTQAEIIEQEEKKAAEVPKAIQNQQMSMKPYDPYHPDPEDKRYIESQTPKENFGFLRFHED